jgi:protein ImuA
MVSSQPARSTNLSAAAPEDTAATGGFIASLVQKLLSNGGACLWINYARRIYPPALKLFG